MAAPANDNFANAQILTTGTQVTGSTLEATSEVGELKGSDDTTTTKSAAGYRTVWFRWSSPGPGIYTFTTAGSDFDTYLTAFFRTSVRGDLTTSLADLTYFFANDDANGNATSSLSVDTTSVATGFTIYFQLAGFSSNGSGNYVFNYPTTASTGPGGSTSATATAGTAAVDATGSNPGAAVTVNAGTADVTTAGQNAAAIVPNLFTTQTPTGLDNADGSPGITTATSVQFTQPGYINAVRFYATTTVSGTYTAALWQVTHDDNPGAGTLLASKVAGTAPAPGGWNLIQFDTPLPVTTGVLYRAGLHSSDGRYVSAASFFNAPLINGQIIAEAHGQDPVGLGPLKQGTFEINAALTYPDESFNQTGYFVDVDYSLTPAAGGTTATAGTANVNAAAFGASTTLAVNAGQAAVTADGLNPAVVTVPVVTVTAGQAAVGVDGQNPNPAVGPNAGLADVTTDASGATVSTSSTATATAGQADVTATGLSPAVVVTAPAGVAAVAADGLNPATSIATPAGVAGVAADAYNPATAITATAGAAAVAADGYNAAGATAAEGIANPGTADVTADGYNPVAQPDLAVAAGQAAVTADAYAATATTFASTTALAGIADVGADAHPAQVLTAVIAAPGTAQAGTDAYPATVITAASAAVTAVEALATTQAVNALIILGVTAGTADVTTVAYDVPKQRRPGHLTAGTRRSTLTAGTRRGPTHTTGG